MISLGLLTFTGSDILSSGSWTKTGPVFTKQPGAYGPGHNAVVVDGRVNGGTFITPII